LQCVYNVCNYFNKQISNKQKGFFLDKYRFMYAYNTHIYACAHIYKYIRILDLCQYSVNIITYLDNIIYKHYKHYCLFNMFDKSILLDR
jgi:hypothetical protein